MRRLPLFLCAVVLVTNLAAGRSTSRPARTSSAGRAPSGTSGTASRAPVPGARLEKESPRQHQAAIEKDRQFSQEAMQKLGVRFAEVETPHFVVWTNVPGRRHQVLASQCEQMYSVLQRIFQTPADEPVFLGKCSVFILASREQFDTFCQIAQNITQEKLKNGTVGFHVGMPDGRTRIIAFWPGNAQQLAEVIVHEGAHAFLYRYRRTRSVVRWFNEGLAEHVVGLVFGQQADEGRDAVRQAGYQAGMDPQLLARIMAPQESFSFEHYPVAQSVVAFLVQANGEAFVRLVQALKDGNEFPEALQQTYNASLAELDTHWRQWLRQAPKAGRPLY